jgi:hypothetical protein
MPAVPSPQGTGEYIATPSLTVVFAVATPADMQSHLQEPHGLPRSVQQAGGSVLLKDIAANTQVRLRAEKLDRRSAIWRRRSART